MLTFPIFSAPSSGVCSTNSRVAGSNRASVRVASWLLPPPSSPNHECAELAPSGQFLHIARCEVAAAAEFDERPDAQSVVDQRGNTQ